jgi:hypothetical protein
MIGNQIVRAVLIVGAPLLFATNVQAQGAPETRKIGLGVSTSEFADAFIVGFGENATISAVTPTIFLPINVSSRVRLEPEVGFGWVTSTSTGSSGRTSSLSTLHVGAGAFGVASGDRHAIYYGARVAFLRYTQSSASDGEPNDYTYPAANGFFVAPTVGGEYFVSSGISIGGEAQLRVTSTTTNAARGGSAINAKTVVTHGLITLRFWFPR